MSTSRLIMHCLRKLNSRNSSNSALQLCRNCLSPQIGEDNIAMKKQNKKKRALTFKLINKLNSVYDSIQCTFNEKKKPFLAGGKQASHILSKMEKLFIKTMCTDFVHLTILQTSLWHDISGNH